MARFETIDSTFDDITLARAIDCESVRIALSDEHRQRLCDFYDIYVRPDHLSYFDGRANYNYGEPRFSGVSRSGTLVTVRNRLLSPGDADSDGLTAVVVGSLYSDDVITLTDTYSESRYGFDGTNIQTILLGLTEPETERGMVIDDFTTFDMALEGVQDYEEFGTTPALTYEHGRWTYRRHDGMDERLSDLERVRREVMAVARRLGATALPKLGIASEALQETGQFSEKVVA